MSRALHPRHSRPLDPERVLETGASNTSRRDPDRTRRATPGSASRPDTRVASDQRLPCACGSNSGHWADRWLLQMSHAACLCYLRPVDDTSTEAALAQAEALRRLGPAKRFLVACDMSEMVRDLARSRIAKQHPG